MNFPVLETSTHTYFDQLARPGYRAMTHQCYKHQRTAPWPALLWEKATPTHQSPTVPQKQFVQCYSQSQYITVPNSMDPSLSAQHSQRSPPPIPSTETPPWNVIIQIIPELVENLGVRKVELDCVQQSIEEKFADIETILVASFLLLFHGDLLQTNYCVFLVRLYFWLTLGGILSVVFACVLSWQLRRGVFWLHSLQLLINE